MHPVLLKLACCCGGPNLNFYSCLTGEFTGYHYPGAAGNGTAAYLNGTGGEEFFTTTEPECINPETGETVYPNDGGTGYYDEDTGVYIDPCETTTTTRNPDYYRGDCVTGIQEPVKPDSTSVLDPSVPEGFFAFATISVYEASCAVNHCCTDWHNRERIGGQFYGATGPGSNTVWCFPKTARVTLSGATYEPYFNSTNLAPNELTTPLANSGTETFVADNNAANGAGHYYQREATAPTWPELWSQVTSRTSDCATFGEVRKYGSSMSFGVDRGMIGGVLHTIIRAGGLNDFRYISYGWIAIPGDYHETIGNPLTDMPDLAIPMQYQVDPGTARAACGPLIVPPYAAWGGTFYVTFSRTGGRPLLDISGAIYNP